METRRVGWIGIALSSLCLGFPAFIGAGEKGGAIPKPGAGAQVAIPGPSSIDDREAVTRAVLAWLVAQTPGAAADDPGMPEFVEWFVDFARPSPAGGLTATAAYYDMGVRNRAAFLALAKAIDGLNPPAAWSGPAKRRLARAMIVERLDADRERLPAALAAALAAGPPQVLAAADHRSLVETIDRAWPGFAGASPAARRAVIEEIDLLNPGIEDAGWYVANAGAPAETWPHVAAPRPGGEIRYLWRAETGKPVLVPAGGRLEAVARAAKPFPEESITRRPGERTLAVLDLPGALPRERGGPDLRLAVVFDADRVLNAAAILPALGDRVVTVNLARQRDGTPPAGEQDHLLPPDPQRFEDDPPWPTTLTRAGDRLSGAVLIDLSHGGKQPAGYLVTLDARLAGGAATGSFACAQIPAGRSAQPREVKGAVAGGGRMPGTAALPAGLSSATFRGPEGSGAYPDGPDALIEDPARLRLAWLGHDLLPCGEGNDMRYVHRAGERILGGFATPAVAGGRVFMAYFRPAGATRVAAFAQPHAAKGGIQHKYRVLADDVVTATDAADGRTLWKTVFPLKGVNRGAFHKDGYQGSPCAAGDRVYVLGTAGRVYALDAATGETRWESDIGLRCRRQRLAMAQQAAKGEAWGGNRDFNNMPRLVDGVLVLVDNLRYTDPTGFYYEYNSGLIGLEVSTGKRLWHVPRCIAGRGNVPVVWRHDGREYVVAVDDRGACAVDPRDGRVLWRQRGPYSELFPPGVCGDVLLAGGDTIGEGPKAARRIAGYRMSPTGCERIWQLPDDCTEYASSFLAYRGHAIVECAGAKAMLVIDPATGRILSRVPHDAGFATEHDNGFLIAGSGRILSSNGRETAGYRYLALEGGTARFLGILAMPRAGGYATAVEPVLLDGRLFVRLDDRLACFDLRVGR